ncbi:hypothetical protein [Sphingomonas sp. Leaf242]|uniref:hypothetical protein n=1 Tax=Sphingomonas sp. Leaf242 TaxID=1736304 RepID=UPI000714A2CC|nr:hypothetical protein [Sphingomonas sp. Leaf242]KQO07059.1 hypothetical protein ASF09_12480 [Sphingomonas sp. Leaf242]
MLAMLLSLLIEDPLIATAKARMAAEKPCIQSADETDITVCGMRHADRFRVPLATRIVERRDMVTEQRSALVHARTPMEDMGPFLVGGGSAGVRATVGFGPGEGSGDVKAGGLRPTAP